MQQLIYTIGHSTRTIEEFINCLKSFHVELLADIRTFPGSRRYPHFNSESLKESVAVHGIRYIHLKELGGRRKPVPGSTNTDWRNKGFQGYADYMETKEFLNAAEELEELARIKTVAYMCSEAVWWRCHRALLSDHLKKRGWKVMHIMNEGKATEHPFTAPEREKQMRLF